MSDDTEYEEHDWSPALRSAIQQIQAQAQRQIQETVQEQAEHLDLPDDAQVDMEQGVWKVPKDS